MQLKQEQLLSQERHAIPKCYGVSFLINNYNYGRFLGDAITSVLNQEIEDEDISYEVIVVDDGSTDHSSSVMAQFGDRITSILKPNGGQASAFNAGVAASSGEWICFLDADDVVRSDKAQIIRQVARAYPDAEWIFHPLQPVDAELILMNETPTDETSTDETLTDETFTDGKAEALAHPIDVRSSMEKGRLDYRKLPFPTPATSGLCIRRSCVAQIFPMPESDGISLNDSYLQYAAMGTSPGLFLSHRLASQRYHGENAFIQRDNPALNARIFLLTAYWLHHRFTALRQFSNQLLACAIVESWRSRSPWSPTEMQQFQQLLSGLNIPHRVRLYSKATYLYLRSL